MLHSFTNIHIIVNCKTFCPTSPLLLNQLSGIRFAVLDYKLSVILNSVIIDFVTFYTIGGARP